LTVVVVQIMRDCLLRLDTPGVRGIGNSHRNDIPMKMGVAFQLLMGTGMGMKMGMCEKSHLYSH